MTLKEWITQSPSSHLLSLSKISSISVAHLYRIASGKRAASVATAASIEVANKKMRNKDFDVITLTRADICETCRKCPHYQSKK